MLAMLRRWLDRFWDWYERHYTLNVGIAAVLFVLQLVHLYWLTTDVVAARLWGVSYFSAGPIMETIVILVDYTEIPALISTSLVYIHSLRTHFNWKEFAYLIFLDIQLLHIFWITDEFVIQQFNAGHAAIMPVWLAWVAIFIDYLELPVIYETVKKFLAQLSVDAAKNSLPDRVVDPIQQE